VLSTHSHHFCRMALHQGATHGLLPSLSLAVAGSDPACPEIWDVDSRKVIIRIPKNLARGLTMALCLPEQVAPAPVMVAGCASTRCGLKTCNLCVLPNPIELSSGCSSEITSRNRHWQKTPRYCNAQPITCETR
jgi:hypothetical protein